MKRKIAIFVLLSFILSACGSSEGINELTETESIQVNDADNTQEAGNTQEVPTESVDVILETEEIGESLGQVEWSASYFLEDMNVGWNLGDSLGSDAKECGYDLNLDLETKWGNPAVTKEFIDNVVSLGFNTIRIPVSWCYNCGRDEDEHLIIGAEWMKRVHEVVDYAMENDVYVIINTMCDAREIIYCGVESEEEWTNICQDARDLWSQIAEEFVDYNDHLIFESYNELNNKEQGWTYSDLAVEQMNTLNQIFVDSVRATDGNNRNRILMVPTLFDSTKTDITDAFVLPEDDTEDSLVVTVHCYEEVFDQDIEWIFQSLEDFSNRVRAPVLISEFGARDDYSLINLREKFTSNYIARAANHGIKCCIWDDGYHWKLIDRYDFEKSDFSMIGAIFEGVEKVIYETDPAEKIYLDSMQNFYFGGLDLETGVITLVDYETKYWATLTTKTKENSLLPIKEGDKLVVTMVTKNQAAEFWIYGVTFFDQDENPISYAVGKNISHRYLCTDIPEGAVYYAVNSFDPYHNHTLEEIEEYFSNGDLKMTITFVDS